MSHIPEIQVSSLASSILQRLRSLGDFATPIAGLSLFGRDQPSIACDLSGWT